MVDENKVAWHAGKSKWKKIKSLNKYSIGIEISNPGHNNKYKQFKKKQIYSLFSLITELKKKYRLKNKNILGHSDIAPYRKMDPGKTFPWTKLSNLNLSYNPKKVSLKESKKIRMWFKKNKIYSNKNKILIMLNFIGYDISKSINNQHSYKSLINNYKNHYLQKSNTKYSNTNLSNSIEKHFCSLLLTKT